MKQKILLGLLVLFILIQFIRIDKTNPESIPAKDFIAIENPPANIATILKNACYDCHSHHTAYPWYTNVAPFSLMIRSHIRGGRQHVNFSTWADYDAKKKNHNIEEMKEVIDSKYMPMKSYTWLHPEAKLSAEDRKVLVDWLGSR